MADVLLDGVVRLLGPVGVHVVNGGRLRCSDRNIKRRHVVIVIFGVVGRGVLLHEFTQIGVGAGGIVAVGHPWHAAFEEWGLVRGGFLFGHIEVSNLRYSCDGELLEYSIPLGKIGNKT